MNRGWILMGTGLLLENVHLSDESIYTYTAENRAGHVEGVVELRVMAASDLTVNPAQLIVNDDHDHDTDLKQVL